MACSSSLPELSLHRSFPASEHANRTLDKDKAGLAGAMEWNISR
jgi:hypothetical protein